MELSVEYRKTLSHDSWLRNLRNTVLLGRKKLKPYCIDSGDIVLTYPRKKKPKIFHNLPKWMTLVLSTVLKISVSLDISRILVWFGSTGLIRSYNWQLLIVFAAHVKSDLEQQVRRNIISSSERKHTFLKIRAFWVKWNVAFYILLVPQHDVSISMNFCNTLCFGCCLLWQTSFVGNPNFGFQNVISLNFRCLGLDLNCYSRFLICHTVLLETLF